MKNSPEISTRHKVAKVLILFGLGATAAHLTYDSHNQSNTYPVNSQDSNTPNQLAKPLAEKTPNEVVLRDRIVNKKVVRYDANTGIRWKDGDIPETTLTPIYFNHQIFGVEQTPNGHSLKTLDVFTVRDKVGSFRQAWDPSDHAAKVVSNTGIISVNSLDNEPVLRAKLSNGHYRYISAGLTSATP
ncbi:MAG: hypothetical protein NVS1B10_02160 [Candidatus Saccharimonadales bacterium]